MTNRDKGAPITREEMIEMFGDAMPIEAVRLAFESPDNKTIGEIRDELRALAKSMSGMKGLYDRAARRALMTIARSADAVPDRVEFRSANDAFILSLCVGEAGVQVAVSDLEIKSTHAVDIVELRVADALRALTRHVEAQKPQTC